MTILRLLLVLALTVGILAPRASAIAMELMPETFQTIIICTGDSMRVITIDETGTPVELGEAEMPPCVMTTGALPEAPHVPLWQVLARVDALRSGLSDQVRVAQTAHFPPPGQGPPLTV